MEQRVQEDLAFGYLAGKAGPDYGALNALRHRPRLAINDCFTHVVGLAGQKGMVQLSRVATDATRIKASASADKVVWPSVNTVLEIGEGMLDRASTQSHHLGGSALIQTLQRSLIEQMHGTQPCDATHVGLANL